MYTRRNFIKSIIRQTSMAVLVFGSGYLIFRETTDEKCNFDFICKKCKNLKECKLPEAQEYKNK